ncbi:hypothetical protein [Serratia fonticola]|uniref:hypothetical protein n=1 Tax=Serratia fonticola TaxID=47917 RepID=UPI002DBC76B2|nr:hypothetical protein [Serratia fonticola]MEB7886053.1 hypothetical protein [Serratia fonticola]
MTTLTQVFELQTPSAIKICRIGIFNDIPNYFSIMLLSQQNNDASNKSISICDGGILSDNVYGFVINGTINAKNTQDIAINKGKGTSTYYRGFTGKAKNKTIDTYIVRDPSEKEGNITISWPSPNADLQSAQITAMNHFYDESSKASNRLFLTESSTSLPYGRFIVCDTKNNTQLQVSDMMPGVELTYGLDSLAVWKGIMAFKINNKKPGIFAYNYTTNKVDVLESDVFNINGEQFSPVDLCVDQRFNSLIVFMTNENTNAVLRAVIGLDGVLVFNYERAIVYKKEYTGTYVTCYNQITQALYAVPSNESSPESFGKIEVIRPFSNDNVEYMAQMENAITIALDEVNNLLYCGRPVTPNTTASPIVSIYKIT